MMVGLFAPYAVIFVLGLFGGGVATFGVGLAFDQLTLSLPLVVAVIVIADTVSDAAYYFLGRFASDALHARFFGLRKKSAFRFAIVKQYYDEHGISTVFLGKMSDVLAIPAVVLAGAAKMPFIAYLSVCVPTSLLKTGVILAAGYLLSRSTDTSDANFVVYGIGGVFLLVLVIVVARQFYVAVKKNAKANTKAAIR